MIKRLLTDKEYTITGTKTIVIDNEINFEQKNLNLIIDTVDNRIVYNFACDDKRATVLGQIITLLDETVALTDTLTIILSFDQGSEIARLEENILWNSRQEKLLAEMLEEQKITNKILKKIYNPE